MRLNDLLYGEVADIADYISGTEDDFTDMETKALLTNLCRRVAALEKRSADRDEAVAETVIA